MDAIKGYNPILLALLGTIFTWLMTAAGAAVVLLKKDISKKFLDLMLGFASGVMIAASYWSLLAPAIEISEELGFVKWFPPLVGFLAGGFFLRLVDKILPHLHPNLNTEEPEGIKTSLKKTTLLILAITLHNFPEGLAVGVAFGSIAYGLPGATFAGAIALTIGIGIQNLPEGSAVSFPLRREGFSPWKSFFYGQLSGIVEPIAGVIGALFVILARPLLPFALSFAAGAMIFVVIEDTIPESQSSGNTDLATMGSIVGFAIMMLLDVALG